MTTATLTPTQRAGPDAQTQRAESLTAFLSELGTSPDQPSVGELESAAETVLDALLAGEQAVLLAAAGALEALEAVCKDRDDDGDWQRTLGSIQILLLMASAGADRLPSEDDMRAITIGSRSHQLLRALRDHESMNATELAQATGMHDTTISKLASTLRSQRLVSRAKVGREVFWDITPRGSDALDEVDRRRKVRRRQLARQARVIPETTITSILAADSDEAFVFDANEIRRSLDRTRTAERSRALFTALLAERPESIREQLEVWASFAQFVDGPVEFRLSKPGDDATRIDNLTRELLSRLQIPNTKAQSLDWVWPARLPAWDGWSLVKNKTGRPGALFVEAKSEVQELKARLPIGPADTREALASIVEGARRHLGATKEWGLWPSYADPAARLAFLYRLRELDVPAWWLNVYFVDPHRVLPKSPASEDTWQTNIDASQEGLDVAADHALKAFVKHIFIPVPAEAIALTS